MAENITQLLEEKETELDDVHQEGQVVERSLIELSSAQAIAAKIKHPLLETLDVNGVYSFIHDYKKYKALIKVKEKEVNRDLPRVKIVECLSDEVITAFRYHIKDLKKKIKDFDDKEVKTYLKSLLIEYSNDRRDLREHLDRLEKKMKWDVTRVPVARVASMFEIIEKDEEQYYTEDYFRCKFNARKRAELIVKVIKKTQPLLADRLNSCFHSEKDSDEICQDKILLREKILILAEQAYKWRDIEPADNTKKIKDVNLLAAAPLKRKYEASREKKQVHFVERASPNKSRTLPDWVVCFKCNENHLVNNCPTATEQEKETLVKNYREKKAASSVNRVGSERGNSFLYIGGCGFPFELDSGSDVSCICMNMLQDIPDRLRKNDVEFKEIKKLTLADKTHSVDAVGTVNMTVNIITVVGSIYIRNIQFNIIKQALEYIFIGKDVQKALGILPIDRLVELRKLGKKEFILHPTDVDDVDSDDQTPQISQVCLEDMGQHVQLAMTSLVREALKNGLPAELESELTRIVCKYEPLWRTTQGLDEPASVHPMEVKLIPGTHPIRCATRRYNELQRNFMHEHVKMLVDAGLLYKNPDSAWASPALVVKKSDGTYRMCVDLRAVNAVTISSAWPMPMLEVVLQSLEGSTCYATLDLWKGYWQFPLAEHAREIHSLMTDEGVFTPTRIIQGSKNGVNYFQAGMQEALGDILYRGALLWIDDILIYADDPVSLLSNLDVVFNSLLNRKIRCSVKKCHLFLREARWCGRLISANGISAQPEKIQALVTMQRPRTAADLQQFLCAMNWLRTCLPDFVRVAAVLSGLLEIALRKTQSRKHKEAVKLSLDALGWNKEHDDAFENCKKLLLNAVTLAYPDPKQIFCLFTDASELSWGAILTQVPEEDLELPIEDQHHVPLSFLGGSFKDSTFNWPIIEKEGFALMQACSKNEHLLIRDKGFKIFTDHKNLLFLFDPLHRPAAVKKYTEAKLERWALRLHAFPFSIEHIEGKRNVWADLLSRWGAKRPLPELHDDDLDLLLASLANSTGRSELEEWPWFPNQVTNVPVHGNMDICPENSGNLAIHALGKTFAAEYAGVRPLQGENFIWPTLDEIQRAQSECSSKILFKPCKGLTHIRCGVVRYNLDETIWIPEENDNLKLRLMVIAHCASAGHRGMKATYESIASRYSWKGLSNDVKQFVRECLHCVVLRGGQKVPRTLGTAVHATQPNQVLHFDFMHMTDLVDISDQGECKELLVLKDDFSHFVELVPCASANAQSVVNALLEWFSRFGVVYTWVSDQGSHFKNAVVKDLNDRLQAQHHFTLPYCPWANGTVERVNRDILDVFRALLSEYRLLPRQWMFLKPLVQNALNHTIVKSLNNEAPVTVFTGLKPSNPLDAVYMPSNTLSSVRVSPEFIQNATMKLCTSLQEMHKNINIVSPRNDPAIVRNVINFDVGDFVLIARPIGVISKEKLKAVWHGPMKIVKLISSHVYEVEDLISHKTMKVHVQRMRFYKDSSLQVTDELKLQIAHDTAAFEVEQIKGHRYLNKRWECLVQWLGFESEDTWEPLISLFEDVPALVKAYLKLCKNTPECTKMVLDIRKKFHKFSLE